MKRWDLTALPPSSRKETDRAPGADATRVPREGSQAPRVLCSYPECRVVAIELLDGEALGDHHVRQRALLQVVGGTVAIDSEAEGAVQCGAGTFVSFEPGEHHAVRALADAQLLLILAPWSGDELPANAVVDPI